MVGDDAFDRSAIGAFKSQWFCYGTCDGRCSFENDLYLAQVIRRISVQETVAAGSAESFGQYVSEQKVQEFDSGKRSALPGVGFRFEVLEGHDPVVVA